MPSDDHHIEQAPAPSGGLPYAISAYLIWGLVPIYLVPLLHVPPVELIGWRIIFTLPICVAILLARRQLRHFRLAIANPRAVGLLLTSALLIAANWITFVLAVQSGHVLATSLGYFINPLVNVLFGTLFLRERLSRWQLLAVVIAGCGVSVLAWDALDTLWISLTLAVTFASYGLVRRVAPVESLPGLTIEALLLLVPAGAIAAWYGASRSGSAVAGDPMVLLWVAGFGLLTAVPLLLFATAARRMDFSTLGFVQYIAPTLSFIAGLVVFHERMRPAQIVCFIMIWTAIAVFTFDLVSKLRARRKASGA